MFNNVKIVLGSRSIDVFLFLFAVFSVILRVLFFNMVSWDYENAWLPWFEVIKSKGFYGIAEEFYGYPRVYIYVLYLLTFVPLNLLYSVKIIAVIFDIFLAFLVSKVVFELTKNSTLSKISFVIILWLPTVVMNSSYWGQNDSMYVSFVILSLLLFIKKKYFWAYFSFGLALSIKPQAVFVLPAIVIITINYLLYNKDFRFLLYLLLVPIIYLISGIPAFIAGMDIFNFLIGPIKLSNAFSSPTMGAPNIYTFLPMNIYISYGSVIFIIGMVLSFTITLFFMVYYIVSYPRYKQHYEIFTLLIFLLFALVEPYFLPRMHDRYFYIADILSVVFAFCFRDKWFLPVVVVVSSTLAYIQVNILLGLSMVAVPLGVVILWYILFILNSFDSIN